jgi:hypothetical protein
MDVTAVVISTSFARSDLHLARASHVPLLSAEVLENTEFTPQSELSCGNGAY